VVHIYLDTCGSLNNHHKPPPLWGIIMLLIMNHYINFDLRAVAIIVILSKKTGGHVTSAFGTPGPKLGLGIVQTWG